MNSPIETILCWPHADLTPLELADMLGIARQGITEAIRAGRIEALALNLRGAADGQRRYRITKAAAIRWLWANTTGDRAQLRSSLERFAPRLLRELEAGPQIRLMSMPARRRAVMWDQRQLELFEEAAAPGAAAAETTTTTHTQEDTCKNSV